MGLLRALVCALVLWPSIALAQERVDVGLLLGSTSTSDEGGALAFRRATTYEATLAWRLWQNRLIKVSLEVPFLASPAFDVATPGVSLPKEYASLYLTPGVRVTAFSGRRVSLFGAAGAGYARYSESKLRIDNSPNPAQRDTNTDAIQWGGGIDVQLAGALGARAEVRDLWTGARNFSVATPGGRVHNVVTAAGLVLTF